MLSIFKCSSLLFLLAYLSQVQAQLMSDDFSDGNFTEDPVWSGSTTAFLVNASGQLQLSGDCISGGEDYLSTPVATGDTATWECLIILDFDPSGSNNTRFYLQSDNSNLSDDLNGYYIKIGEDGSSDALRLYRQNGSSSTLLLTGSAGAVSTSPNVRIRVVRTTTDEWQLYADYAGGSSFTLEGTVVDDGGFTASYMGVFADYTATRCSAFFFDDFSAGPLYTDIDPPVLLDLTISAAQQLTLTFNEALEPVSANSETNYSVDAGMGNPINALLGADGKTVTLTFVEDFPSGTLLQLELDGIQDLSGNSIIAISVPFSYYEPSLYDVVMTEIMADPSPTAGLPEQEYIELYNTTDLPIDLGGWTFSDAGSDTDPFPDFTLLPGQYVIICDLDDAALFMPFGEVLAPDGFPSLNNSNDSLYLRSDAGELIHRVFYTDNWYHNSIKAEGGYSLEMIDPANPCQGEDNWSASEHLDGGTPGQENSILASNPDVVPPGILSVYPVSENSIQVFFDEPVLAASVSISGFDIDNGIGMPSNIEVAVNDPSLLVLELATSLIPNVLYTLNCSGVTDCNGNAIGLFGEASFGIPDSAVAGDILINEILFNPVSGGYDFVEFVNHSDKILDLSTLRLVELNAEDSTIIDEFCLLSTQPRLILPGAYLVLSENIEEVDLMYSIGTESVLENNNNFPNFPDDEGILLLETTDFVPIDRLRYTDDWHYALLDTEDGVSLERLRLDEMTQSESNWHSAAEDAGYATPGRLNSVHSDFTGSTSTFTLESEVFSPDGDGYHDVLVMAYLLPQAGYSARVSIFDMGGREVIVLSNNVFLGTEGIITWDGISDNGLATPMGIYVISIELFNLEGKVEHQKLKCTLARKS